MYTDIAESAYVSEYEPSDKVWEVLPKLPDEELAGLGLKPWDEDKQIWLFPTGWYEHIPEGMEITTINGKVKEFDRDEDLKERRFGVLPYGISRPSYNPNSNGIILERNIDG